MLFHSCGFLINIKKKNMKPTLGAKMCVPNNTLLLEFFFFKY